ncbi:MAG: radical SAM protein [Deltaproteobacteria bacterium]|nr:radical SAM protein [Candidatus Zymogenaceae bacterium]
MRLTRNCPWNKCAFCPVYKGARFSLRDVDDIKGDIDAMAAAAEEIKGLSWRMGAGGEVTEAVAREVFSGTLGAGQEAKYIAFWLFSGGQNVFLQDADSLVMKPADVAEVLAHLKKAFPGVSRITTYARSATVARIKPQDLKSLREAGLTRVHIGMESGSDDVLKYMKKGSTADIHIRGGLNVRDAGLELSEYVMPGLGGRRWTRQHAEQTARVLNAVNPHFIRLRSLHVHRVMPLAEEVQSGEFELLTDDEVAAEIRLFISGLAGITSVIVSDHILNLLEEIEGRLPDDRQRMLSAVDRYLGLPQPERLLFVLARRAGLVRGVQDISDPDVRMRAERIRDRLAVTDTDDATAKIRELMDGYI